MQHVYPNMVVATVGVAQPEQKSQRVQVPLNFFELDTPFAEHVTQGDVQDDNDQQRDPHPGNDPADLIDDAIDAS